MAGTYEFDDDMCDDRGGSALCIDRSVTIEAEVAGSVVLDAKNARRVVYVASACRAEFVGLHITGGNTANYVSACILNLLRHFIHAIQRYALHLLACRVVASLSATPEWPTLKDAISMTMLLLPCACTS